MDTYLDILSMFPFVQWFLINNMDNGVNKIVYMDNPSGHYSGQSVQIKNVPKVLYNRDIHNAKIGELSSNES